VRRRDSLGWPIVLAMVSFACGAVGQDCPRANPSGADAASQTRTLEGRLVFQDDIRGWWGLELNKPQCGQKSVQLMPKAGQAKALQVLRGCRIKSTGALDFSPTGYYTLDVFQDVERVEPIGRCLMKPPFPDEPPEKPDKRVSAYTVDMHLIYPGPIRFHVRSGGRTLRSPRAYASYFLTGGFVLYGQCADGFVVDRVFGTPEARPGHFEEPRMDGDMADFDPENAARAGKHNLHLDYSCVRAPPEKH